MQHVLQCLLVENADPSDTNPFGASCKPEILNGADRGIEGSFWHGVAAESMSAFTFWIVDDAEVLRRFQNPFELQAGVFLRMVALVGFECLAVRLQKNIMDTLRVSIARMRINRQGCIRPTEGA